MLCASSLAAAATPARAVSDPASSASDPTGVLAAYVARADASYEWREAATGRVGGVEYVELTLTSQTWREIPWKHQLFVLLPSRMSNEGRHGLIFIDGGRWKAEYEDARLPETALPRRARLFARLAEMLQSPVGVLRQVPFQPLFERREDALIAYTLDRYLATGDADWPLLLPMVKSAVRGMDAMQELARLRWTVPIETFTVSGASKRGWTTWLTAAIDARVTAIAPIVIDVLNMREQIAHQTATWGELSDQIRDYTDLAVPERLRSEPRGAELLSMVDPYAYRARLTQSKLIVLATNDPYWPLDALGLYWGGLPEPKRVLYLANQDHDVDDYDRVIGSISALHRYVARQQPLPVLSWEYRRESQRLMLEVQSDRSPRRVRLWVAHSPSRDFREARWVPQSCARTEGRYSCTAATDESRYMATFAELTFKDRGAPTFSLSTTVCIAAPPDAAAQASC
jgi:PhoPQ-activated pathogenicity-related protein